MFVREEKPLLDLSCLTLGHSDNVFSIKQSQASNSHLHRPTAHESNALPLEYGGGKLILSRGGAPFMRYRLSKQLFVYARRTVGLIKKTYFNLPLYCNLPNECNKSTIQNFVMWFHLQMSRFHPPKAQTL